MKKNFKEKKTILEQGFTEKRQGKMTIARALDLEMSELDHWSIKRRREKARMQADRLLKLNS